MTCSHYHTSRKIPGKLQETILSQPFFPAIMGRYACQVGVQYPEGGSSYHTRPRPAYRELPRASAGVKINKSSLKSARSAHTTELATCNAHANLRRPARPPGFLLLDLPATVPMLGAAAGTTSQAGQTPDAKGAALTAVLRRGVSGDTL